MAKKQLTKDDILSANDIYKEEIDVPEWGGTVFVKTLSGEERDKLEASIISFGPSGQARGMRTDKLRSTLAVLGICDKDGNPIFAEKDIPALAKKSASALDRVVVAIQRLAGMSPADVDSLIGELKNDQPAALPSD